MKMKKAVKMMPPKSSAKGKKIKMVISYKKLINWRYEVNTLYSKTFEQGTFAVFAIFHAIEIFSHKLRPC